MSELTQLKEMPIQVRDYFKHLEKLVDDWVIKGHDAYAFIKKMDKATASISKKIQDKAFDEYAEMWKWELEDMPHWTSISATQRATYQYWQNELYAQKKKELKELEQAIKAATDKPNIKQVLEDTWEIIWGVDIKYAQSYTMRHKS